MIVKANVDKVRIWDGTTITEVDPLGALSTVGTVHHKVHEGNSYTFFHYSADVDIASPLNVVMSIGSEEAHMTTEVKTDGGGEYAIYESPTISVSGTPITVFNRNRTSANTAKTTVTYGDTIGATGTKIASSYIFAVGGGVTRVGGEVRTDTERILAPNIKYLFRFTPSADNTKVNVRTSFYEVS